MPEDKTVVKVYIYSDGFLGLFKEFLEKSNITRDEKYDLVAALVRAIHNSKIRLTGNETVDVLIKKLDGITIEFREDNKSFVESFYRNLCTKCKKYYPKWGIREKGTLSANCRDIFDYVCEILNTVNNYLRFRQVDHFDPSKNNIMNKRELVEIEADKLISGEFLTKIAEEIKARSEYCIQCLESDLEYNGNKEHKPAFIISVPVSEVAKKICTTTPLGESFIAITYKQVFDDLMKKYGLGTVCLSDGTDLVFNIKAPLKNIYACARSIFDTLKPNQKRKFAEQLAQYNELKKKECALLSYESFIFDIVTGHIWICRSAPTAKNPTDIETDSILDDVLNKLQKEIIIQYAEDGDFNNKNRALSIELSDEYILGFTQFIWSNTSEQQERGIKDIRACIIEALERIFGGSKVATDDKTVTVTCTVTEYGIAINDYIRNLQEVDARLMCKDRVVALDLLKSTLENYPGVGQFGVEGWIALLEATVPAGDYKTKLDPRFYANNAINDMTKTNSPYVQLINFDSDDLDRVLRICVYLNSIFGCKNTGCAEVSGGILRIQINDLLGALQKWHNEKTYVDAITPYYEQQEKEVDKKDGIDRSLKFKPIKYKVIDNGSKN